MQASQTDLRTAGKTSFVTHVFISLLLSNAEKNMYWSRFFEVFEEARDRFLEEVATHILKSIFSGSLIPIRIELKHLLEVFPGQTLEIYMTLEKQESRFIVKAEYMRDEDGGKNCVAKATQRLHALADEMKLLDKKQYPCAEIPIFVRSGDIGPLGEVHWVTFAHWLGYAREKFISQEVPQVMEMMKKGLVIITRETSINFINPSHFGEVVIVRVRVQDICKFRLSILHFEFVKLNNGKEELLAQATQKLAYAQVNHITDNVEAALIPTEFLKIGGKYLMNKSAKFFSNLARFVVKGIE